MGCWQLCLRWPQDCLAVGLPGGDLVGTVTPVLMASLQVWGGMSEVSHIVSQKGAGSGITAASKQSHFSA